MLSYQHGYHAGNFADVIKHLTLSRLLTYMVNKEKPLFYLETHAGRGLYDFKDSQAEKTGEYKQGINLLWNRKADLPPLFKPYLQLLKEINPSNELRFYPGSPTIALDMLREQDRLYCCEMHPREFEHLEKLPHHRRRIHFSHSDGVNALSALLPPPERRGLVFIDPSYEIKTEYKQIPYAIKDAYKHFSNGVFCLWYPIVDKRLHEQLLRAMADIHADKNLKVEFYLTNSPQAGMTGCGLWIINPPYLLADEMKTVLQQLRRFFNTDRSSFLVETL